MTKLGSTGFTLSLGRHWAPLAIGLGMAACGRSGDGTTPAPIGAGSAANGGSGIASSEGGTSATQGGASGGSRPSNQGGVIDPKACEEREFDDKYAPGYTAAADPRVDAVLGQMTLAQKILQMSTMPRRTVVDIDFDDISRAPNDDVLEIRGFKFRDGTKGVNLFPKQPDRESLNNYSTAFPVGAARGAAFDLELEFQIGAAIGDETVASGNNLLFAPCAGVLHHPAWGRAQESYGEDVYHVGRSASAFTAGAQKYIGACAFAFVANDIEHGRADVNVLVDERTLREIYARPFEMAIQDGGVACIMAAFNAVNGVKATQNQHLLSDILRDDFGFRGFVITDSFAMPYGAAAPDMESGKATAAEAVGAGLDVERPVATHFPFLEAAVADGLVSADAIDRSARRVLEQKFRFHSALALEEGVGLRTSITTLGQGSIVGNDEHIDLSREAAVRSMVLLKNDGSTLPIRTDGPVSKLAVIGAELPFQLRLAPQNTGTLHLATDQPLGDQGSSFVNTDPEKTRGPFEGLSRAASASGITVVSGTTAAAAIDADFVVMMVGLGLDSEGEELTQKSGGDRLSFALPGTQDALVEEVALLGKPMVVVIEAGSVVDLPWLSRVPAVVMAWYPGQQGGTALAELLFGTRNFSGKLPFTWPRSFGDLPSLRPEATPNEVTMPYLHGYRYFEENAISPLFPFGHGLSYTTFSYSRLSVPCSDVDPQGILDVTVDVKNDSATPGDEVVFLFVSYPDDPSRPSKELKSFQRVSLEGNETQRITLPLRISDLKRWDTATSAWVIDSGTIRINVGPSAADDDLTLSATVTIR